MKFTLYAVLFLGLSALISFSHVHAHKTGVGAPQRGEGVELADAHVEPVALRSSAPNHISGKGNTGSRLIKLLIPTLILATLAFAGSKYLVPLIRQHLKKPSTEDASKLYEKNVEEIKNIKKCDLFYPQESHGVKLIKHVKLTKGEVTDKGFSEAYMEAEMDPESAFNKSVAAKKPEFSFYTHKKDDFSLAITAKVVPPSVTPKPKSPLADFLVSLEKNMRKGITGIVESVTRKDGVSVNIDVSVIPVPDVTFLDPTNKDKPISKEMTLALYNINFDEIQGRLLEALPQADDSRASKDVTLYGQILRYTMTTAKGTDEVDPPKGTGEVDPPQGAEEGHSP